MTRIAISSLASASRCLAEWEPDAILSVVSPSMRSAIPTAGGVRHLRLFCHDLELPKVRGLSGPSRRQVEAAIALFREGRERILIHCGFGLSRAPAFAIIALVIDGFTPADAAGAIRAAVPTAQPNRRILALADSVLGLDGSLSATASAFVYRRAMTGARGSPIRWIEVKSTGEAKGSNPLRDATGQAAEIPPPPAVAGGLPR